MAPQMTAPQREAAGSKVTGEAPREPATCLLTSLPSALGPACTQPAPSLASGTCSCPVWVREAPSALLCCLRNTFTLGPGVGAGAGAQHPGKGMEP